MVKYVVSYKPFAGSSVEVPFKTIREASRFVAQLLSTRKGVLVAIEKLSVREQNA